MRKIQEEPINTFMLLILAIAALAIIIFFIMGMPGRTASNTQTANEATLCQTVCDNLASTGMQNGTTCCQLNKIAREINYTSNCQYTTCSVAINGRQCLISNTGLCICLCGEQTEYDCGTTNDTNECCIKARTSFPEYTNECTQACSIDLLMNDNLIGTCIIP